MPRFDLRRDFQLPLDGRDVVIPVFLSQPAMGQPQARITIRQRGQRPAECNRFARWHVLGMAQPGRCARSLRVIEQQHRLQVRQLPHLERDLPAVQREKQHGQRLPLACHLRAEIEAHGLGLFARVAHDKAPADRLRFHRPELNRESQCRSQVGVQAQVVRRERDQHRRRVICLRFEHLPPPDNPHRHDARQSDAPAVARFQADRRFVRRAQVKLPDLVILINGAPGSRVGGDAGGHRVAIGQVPFAHEIPRQFRSE